MCSGAAEADRTALGSAPRTPLPRGRTGLYLGAGAFRAGPGGLGLGAAGAERSPPP